MGDTPPRIDRLTARVHGYVQGVGYRFFVQRQAGALGLRGYTRNLGNGDVEVVAEGERARLEQLLHALRRGPTAAEVETVAVEWNAGTGIFSSFQIRH